MLLLTSPMIVLRRVVVTKPLASGILFSTSPIVVLRTVEITKPITSGIRLSTSSISFSKFCVVLICLN